MKIGKWIKYGIFAVVGYVVVSSMGLLDKLPISPTMLIILLVALTGVWFWQKRKKAGGGGEKF